MQLLDNKVAIITGASSGIGYAAALLFAAQGARIVASGRNGDALNRLKDEIMAQGGSIETVTGDVRQEATHAALVARALERFGRLDIALNNAGTVGRMAPLTEQSIDDWRDVIDANLTSAFLGARAQIPAMLKSGEGSIIFTGSFVGSSAGLPGMSLYGTSKAALTGLVKGITADFGAQGIRANALFPGGTRTGMAGDAAQQEWAASLHAMKRIAEPEEIAQAALFLASDMASFVTGAVLWADGGNSAVKL
ncbi:MAG: SDR family oxidoreductase [Alphaproteobacteria bacterium]